MRQKSETLQLLLRLPIDIKTRVDLALWSQTEQRVPKGDYQKFFIARIREYFEWDGLDLSLYGLPPGSFVRGPKDCIADLRMRLEAIEHANYQET